MIRKPIITVLGHVDAGKTSFLDKIRGTAIAAREAGNITQHIGATEVPIEIIRELAGDLLQKYKFDIKLSGLLFIDTPGHEAFTNLRKRGGSIADLAVLVVDILQGLQPQTLEAIDILRTFKVPFIVFLSKVDKLPGWNPGYGSITNGMKKQSEDVLRELDNRIYEIAGQLYQKGFQSDRFDRVADFTKQIPIIPGSTKLGEGLAETLVFLAGLSQRFMEKKLTIEVSGPGKGTILEVKEEKGLGKTVDVILYDGELKVGDEVVLGGKRGVIRTKVRALLEPKPLNEIRDPKEKFNNVKKVHAAAGVKVAAPNLEDALAGSPLLVASNHEEENKIREELNEIEVEQDSNGPIIRTDSLGALEALVKLLAEKQIRPRTANVGEVTRKDIIEAHSVAEKEPFKGVIFAFNSRVLPEAEEESKKLGVRIFKQNVIYKLLEDYSTWVQETQNAEKQKLLVSLVFPARIKLLPQFVFRNSKPAIIGVRVLEGRLKVDSPLMRSDGKIVGKVLGIQSENQAIREAKKNMEVAVSIDDATIGRDIRDDQELLVFLSNESIAQLEKIGNELSLEEKELLEEVKKIKQKRGDAE